MSDHKLHGVANGTFVQDDIVTHVQPMGVISSCNNQVYMSPEELVGPLRYMHTLLLKDYLHPAAGTLACSVHVPLTQPSKVNSSLPSS